MAIAEFHTDFPGNKDFGSPGGGGWSYPTGTTFDPSLTGYRNIGQNGKQYVATHKQSSVSHSAATSGDYNYGVDYTVTPGLSGVPGTDSIFVAGGYFLATAGGGGGAGGSTSGFNYTNFGSSNRLQFIYQTNITSTGSYMPSWTTSSSSTFTLCAFVLWYWPGGYSVMII
jgi:hypothetical protein